MRDLLKNPMSASLSLCVPEDTPGILVGDSEVAVLSGDSIGVRDAILEAVEFYKKYQWRPIESAPFDDNGFLVATKCGYVCHAEFVDNGVYQIELDDHAVYEIIKDWSYWMPVPEVPNDEE